MVCTAISITAVSITAGNAFVQMLSEATAMPTARAPVHIASATAVTPNALENIMTGSSWQCTVIHLADTRDQCPDQLYTTSNNNHSKGQFSSQYSQHQPLLLQITFPLQSKIMFDSAVMVCDPDVCIA